MMSLDAKTAALGLCLILSAGGPGQIRADGYPSKPIKLVVAHAAGSSIDLRARQIAERMARGFGQGVVVENRPGVGGTMGAGYVARAAPDGYTLLFGGTSELGTALVLYPDLSYDPATDFTPIGQAAVGPPLLLVNPGLGVRDVAGLIALAKAKPGTLTCASYGSGSLTHLMLLEFNLLAGTDITHVPYKNAAQGLIDVMAGQVSMMFDYAVNARSFVTAGRLQALMVNGSRRLSVLPEVPAAAELGMPGMSSMGWNGLLAPRGTPRDIVERLHRELVRVLRSPEMESVVAESGSLIVASTPEAFAAFLQAELKRMRDLVKRTGAKLD